LLVLSRAEADPSTGRGTEDPFTALPDSAVEVSNEMSSRKTLLFNDPFVLAMNMIVWVVPA
jgi:hypothetical protein